MTFDIALFHGFTGPVFEDPTRIILDGMLSSSSEWYSFSTLIPVTMSLAMHFIRGAENPESMNNRSSETLNGELNVSEKSQNAV